MIFFRRNKRWLSAVIAVVVCAAGVFSYVQLHGKSKQASGQELSYTVKRGDLRASVTGTSQLEPRDVQTVQTPADGTIQTMNLTRNTDVKQGDVLFVLDSPTLRNNSEKAKISLAAAETDWADVQTQIANLRAKAPIAGKLTYAQGIDAGAMVNKSTKIATIAGVDHLSVTLPFALEDASRLAVGNEVDLSIDGFMLTKTGTIADIRKKPRADMKGGKLIDVDVAVTNDATMDAGLKASGTVTAGGAVMESRDPGTLQYTQTATVLANTSGTIEKLPFAAGGYVKAGDVIAQVKNDALLADLAAKQSTVEQQKLNVQELQGKLDELTVKAPFDGVFSTDFADKKKDVLAGYSAGAKVQSGTAFGSVASLQYMQLPIQVDELDLPNVKTGMKAEVRVDSMPGRVFQAEVGQVSTVGTTTNGVTTYDAVLSVQNANNQLKYGMTATGEILFQDKKNVVLIPTEFLARQRGKNYVSLKKADGTVEKQREIQTGIRSKTQVEITAGLQEGDVIVMPQTQQPQKLSQQELDNLRKQFQQGGGQLTQEQRDQLRQQFGAGGGGNFGGASGGSDGGVSRGNGGNGGNGGNSGRNGNGRGNAGNGGNGGN